MQKYTLITGASSGIGRDMARLLKKRGASLILVARNEEKLRTLAQELGGDTQVIVCDVTDPAQLQALFEQTKDRVDTLINNAGFGLFGEFTKTDLAAELALIDTNLRAPHMLMKWFLSEFVARDEGRILNICSAAAFAPGPRMAAYYASKAYLLHLSEAVSEELRQSGSHVTITAACPGPIRTAFTSRAGVRFTSPALSSKAAARRILRGMDAKKRVVIPGAANKVGRFLTRILPQFVIDRAAYRLQKPED